MAEKLIPGIPIPTRISILQQTSTEAAPSASTAGETSQAKSAVNLASQLSVVAEVIDRATSRNDIQREIDGEPPILLSIFTTAEKYDYSVNKSCQ